jgi:magnesium transporter
MQRVERYQPGCWVHVVNPGWEELSHLIEEYGLDQDLLNEGLDEHELPRVEAALKNRYIFVKMLSFEHYRLATLLIVITPDCFITISKEDPFFIKKIIEGRESLVTSKKRNSTIRILSMINDDFEKVVVDIVKSVERKRKITTKLEEKEMMRLVHQEDFLNNLVSTYYYTNLLYTKMLKKIEFLKNERETLNDLIVESNQGLNLCRTSLKKISNLRQYYHIIISNKLNRTIKVLTIFTILISIPAAISSLYGMNIALPFQHHPDAFIFVALIIGFIWVGFVLFLRRTNLI